MCCNGFREDMKNSLTPLPISRVTARKNNHYPNIWVSIQWGGLWPAAAGGSFLSQSLIVWSSQISRLEQTWVTLRQRHTEGAILYEKKLKPFLKSLNEGKGTLGPDLAV